jgi:hypothetical protein
LGDDQVSEIGIYVGTSNPSNTLWCTGQKQPINHNQPTNQVITIVTKLTPTTVNHCNQRDLILCHVLGWESQVAGLW